MIRGVLAPHAVVGPAAKGQEVVLARHILIALRAEAVWVEGVCLCVALHGNPKDDDSQTPRGLCITICCGPMAPWGVQYTSYGMVEATHLHGGRNEGGHEQGALWCREVLGQLEVPLGDLHIVFNTSRLPLTDCTGGRPSTIGTSAGKHSQDIKRSELCDSKQ